MADCPSVMQCSANLEGSESKQKSKRKS